MSDARSMTDTERLARIQEIWNAATPLLERQDSARAQMRTLRDEWAALDAELGALHRELRALSSIPYDGLSAAVEFDGGAA